MNNIKIIAGLLTVILTTSLFAASPITWQPPSSFNSSIAGLGLLQLEGITHYVIYDPVPSSANIDEGGSGIYEKPRTRYVQPWMPISCCSRTNSSSIGTITPVTKTAPASVFSPKSVLSTRHSTTSTGAVLKPLPNSFLNQPRFADVQQFTIPMKSTSIPAKAALY